MRERVWLGLVHHPTLDREGVTVATAVTTLDLHDLARLARTYALGGVYVTTPLVEQQKLVSKLLGHWVDGFGGRLNPCRREALQGVRVVGTLGDAIQGLQERWGAAPLVVATTARCTEGDQVGYADARERIAAAQGAVLLLFGTGWGLAAEALGRAHLVLEAIRAEAGYNHLSVRSAASIVVDRLFGRW